MRRCPMLSRHRSETLKSLERRKPMRAILHAKFDAHVAKLSSTSDKLTGSLGLRDSSVEEFEAALTKARASWRAERGPTRTAIYSGRIARRR